MNHYPYIEVNMELLRQNARTVCGFCRENGIDVAGVIKFSDGCPEIAKAYHEGGCKEIASSRIAHLKRIRETDPGIPTLLIRAPAPEEAEEAVRFCDSSLETELKTLTALNGAAEKLGEKHSVILMLDVGDLREGVLTEEELLSLALAVENRLPALNLRGIGASFCCFGSVLPDRENLTRLSKAAELVEQAIGRPLETVSGGSSGSLIPLFRGELPEKINHLRIGGYIANPLTMRLNRDFRLPGMNEGTFLLHARIIEANRKPTCPENRSGKNWEGKSIEYEDLGVRNRVIAALGSTDAGTLANLLPMEEGLKILGGSSDHLILDTEDAAKKFAVGDELCFRMRYENLLRAFLSDDVSKVFIE
ncbi:MAG: alanine racemase [Eubacteriales bacterium]|nr:alanine racemase [Eubacteriales bacterium]